MLFSRFSNKSPLITFRIGERKYQVHRSYIPKGSYLETLARSERLGICVNREEKGEIVIYYDGNAELFGYVVEYLRCYDMQNMSLFYMSLGHDIALVKEVQALFEYLGLEEGVDTLEKYCVRCFEGNVFWTKKDGYCPQIVHNTTGGYAVGRSSIQDGGLTSDYELVLDLTGVDGMEYFINPDKQIAKIDKRHLILLNALTSESGSIRKEICKIDQADPYLFYNLDKSKRPRIGNYLCYTLEEPVHTRYLEFVFKKNKHAQSGHVRAFSYKVVDTDEPFLVCTGKEYTS